MGLGPKSLLVLIFFAVLFVFSTAIAFVQWQQATKVSKIIEPLRLENETLLSDLAMNEIHVNIRTKCSDSLELVVQSLKANTDYYENEMVRLEKLNRAKASRVWSLVNKLELAEIENLGLKGELDSVEYKLQEQLRFNKTMIAANDKLALQIDDMALQVFDKENRNMDIQKRFSDLEDRTSELRDFQIRVTENTTKSNSRRKKTQGLTVSFTVPEGKLEKFNSHTLMLNLVPVKSKMSGKQEKKYYQYVLGMKPECGSTGSMTLTCDLPDIKPGIYRAEVFVKQEVLGSIDLKLK